MRRDENRKNRIRCSRFQPQSAHARRPDSQKACRYYFAVVAEGGGAHANSYLISAGASLCTNDFQ